MSSRDCFLRMAIGLCAVCAGAHAAASIVINEIHYNPDLKTEHVEFIELFNAGTNTVDLSGWYFSDGVSFTFPNGTFLAPGGYLVVAQDRGRQSHPTEPDAHPGPLDLEIFQRVERSVFANHRVASAGL